MFNIPNTFEKYNPVHSEKLKALVSILSSSTYKFKCLETDEKLFNIRKVMYDQNLPFENAFFQHFHGKVIDEDLSLFLMDNAQLFFNTMAMQKAPDIITLPPRGYSFFDLKLLTNEHPNTIAININSYFHYQNISIKFDQDIQHMGIVICGENEDKFKFLPISNLYQGITPFTVMVYPHTPFETVNELKRIFGDWRVRTAKESNNKLEPFILVDSNQYGIVDLHNYLFNLSENYYQHSSIEIQQDFTQQQQVYPQQDFTQQQQFYPQQ
ncbi:hypothetical protein, partial [Lysinibacillus boronitolerans]|uniref:hypothetical protein n=1 Tax=Lysinibacillus boronitolerans TaxID=309788 RepID=UPI0013E36097